MSEIERQRAREEALRVVGSQPPTASESRVLSAMRRYLGSSMFTMHKKHQGADRTEKTDSEPPQ